MGLFDLADELLDVADDATFGIARKVTPRVIQKPLAGEDITADDIASDAVDAVVTGAILDILSDD